MSKILKVYAFQSVADAIDKNDYATANAILNIINRSIIQDKRNNTFSESIKLNTKKEERYFKSSLILKEQEN